MRDLVRLQHHVRPGIYQEEVYNIIQEHYIKAIQHAQPGGYIMELGKEIKTVKNMECNFHFKDWRDYICLI